WTKTSFSPDVGVMNPNPLSLLKNFTVPVAIAFFLFFLCLRRSAAECADLASRPARGQLLVLVSTRGGLAHLPVPAAVLIVTPPDKCGALADVDRMAGTKHHFGQHDGDREARIIRIRSPFECSARRIARGRRGIAAQGAAHLGVRGSHCPSGCRGMAMPGMPGWRRFPNGCTGTPGNASERLPRGCRDTTASRTI